MTTRRRPSIGRSTEMLLATGAVGLGASAMYVLDPAGGRRRRGRVRDRLIHLAKAADNALAVTAEDVINRTQGLAAEIRARLSGGAVSDDRLSARVRSKLGHYVSHPRSIGVVVNEGRVFLSGPIIDDEISRLFAVVRRLRGVREIVDRLDRHQRSADISGLQGGIRRTGERSGLLQSSWSPTARLLAGMAGSALAWVGARRGPFGLGLGLVGTGLLARAATNLELRRLVGIRAGRRAVDIEKTITVNEPVETVWMYWRDYQYFPSFMSHVRSVRDLGSGRSRWTVDGPAGTSVEWDAMLTAEEPNRLIAWKTDENAAVGHAGIVQLEPEGLATRVHLRMSYNPPGGAVGHGLAWLLGSDAQRLMADDLMRMKSFIETGRPPRDAATRKREG
jgi:uncharacterized membrane protein